MKLTLPKWYDLHAHLRQDELLEPLIAAHKAMGCAGVLAMPNTAPPVAKIFKSEDLDCWSIQDYTEMLCFAGADTFDELIIPLYLTGETTPQMIEKGAAEGALRACKYYPPRGTTGAEFGAPLETYIENGVFKAMEAAGIILCVHGEAHDLPPESYFARDTNAEEVFYREAMPRVIEKFPALKIVCEHVTTQTAVDFVKTAPDTVAATITPQHLLYTAGHLLKGLKYHLYCLPLLKFEEDRAALREAVLDPGNRTFFAGTDSAPHAEKLTDCGCAAGCFTGGIAPQLYAQGFEAAGADLASEKGEAAFRNFLCRNGAAFYGLKVPETEFTLEKTEQGEELRRLETKPGQMITPLPLGLDKDATLPWRIV